MPTSSLCIGLFLTLISFFETQDFKVLTCPNRPYDTFENNVFVSRCGWGNMYLYETVLDLLIVLTSLLNLKSTLLKKCFSIMLLASSFYKLHYLTLANSENGTFYFTLSGAIHIIFSLITFVEKSPHCDKNSPKCAPEKKESQFGNVYLHGEKLPELQKPKTTKPKEIKVQQTAQSNIKELQNKIKLAKLETQEKHRKEEEEEKKQILKNQTKKTENLSQTEEISKMINEPTELLQINKRRPVPKKSKKSSKVVGNVTTQNEIKTKKPANNEQKNKTDLIEELKKKLPKKK
ncbi:hypothetical protein EIN_486930 [Entamoeba invadens IP1]|uniref:Uncharacterized protein n=1 Tax=Entamoeba invadens IP1 TaxID=370355 RepID=A0A0A1U4R9_ENTIV|nr:hypothetical protein EIN_486930 [Entamoeba invadens IP1]ELP89231.1 hypothetical protein EIN_486930 [Entamoeba invadens IP1]|eukprot:XP_004256002.1 hypothetical protein EIN_486930 [Entamoeba invadens IP1]